MKKILSLIVAALLMQLLFTDDIRANDDRNVLVEIFTSTTCPPCRPANQALMNWLNSYEHADRVTVIKYPVSWPSPGCVFHWENPGPVNARRSFYGNITSAPSGVVDGVVTGGGAAGWINAVQNRMNSSAQIQITGEPEIDGNQFSVEVTVAHTSGSVPPQGLRLRTAVVEMDIAYNAPNGSNRQEFVHRDMLPSATGVLVNLPENGEQSFTLSGNIESSWVVENLQLAIFVQQDGSRTVWQSTMIPLIPDVAPRVPELTSPADNATDVVLEPMLEWSEAENASSYSLQLSTSESFSDDLISVNNTTSVNYVVDQLNQNETYFWRVRSHNDAEELESDWSAPFSFTTMIMELASPELVFPINGEEVSNSSVTFEWSEIDFAETYKLQVSTQPYFTSTDMIHDLVVDDNSHTITLENNGTYYWRVRAESEFTESEWPTRGEFVLNTATSINPDEVPIAFALSQNYPNPFNPTTAISFTLPDAGFATLSVYNLNGQLVANLVNEQMSAGQHSVMFNAESLASGTYLYRLKFGDTVLTRKMLLIK